MEAIRSRTQTAKPQQAVTQPAAPAKRSAPLGGKGWRWARATACLIALAQQAVVCPSAALMTCRLLDEDSE